MEHSFNETAMQAKTVASKRQAKAIKARHGPRVCPQTGKGKAKENPGKSTGRFFWTGEGAIQVSKGSGNGKTLLTGISHIENLKSESSPENQESVQMGQVVSLRRSLDEWNDEGSCVGWHEDYKRFVLHIRKLRDNRSAGNTFLVNFDPEGVGDGSSYYLISGVEAYQFQGYDEQCWTGSLNGRLLVAHEVCCSIASACASAPASESADTVIKEQQDFHVEYDGGYMIQIHRTNCQGTRNHFEKLLNEYGMSDLIPVYLEKDALNFCLNREVKSE